MKFVKFDRFCMAGGDGYLRVFKCSLDGLWFLKGIKNSQFNNNIIFFFVNYLAKLFPYKKKN